LASAESRMTVVFTGKFVLVLLPPEFNIVGIAEKVASSGPLTACGTSSRRSGLI